MLTKFSVKKPLTIIMAVIMIIILGVVSFTGMTTDLFPSINLPYAVIITSYDNASPEQVEMFLTRPIEQSMASVSNVSGVSSVSSEEMSIVIMEFTQSTDMDSVTMEMRESLDMMMSYMPSEVSSPMILKLNPDMMPVMVLSVGLEDEDISSSSKWLENNIVPEFESVEGVASVSTSGMVSNQIHVMLDADEIDRLNEEINELMLQAMMEAQPAVDPTMDMTGMTDTQMPEMEPVLTEQLISGMLMGQNFSMPSGYLTEENTSYLVRVGEKLDTLDSIENISIFEMEGMDTIYLKDVANVTMVDDADSVYTKVNGNDAIMLTVQKQTEYATSDVSKSIRDKMDEVLEDNDNVVLTTIMDQGEYIDMVVNGVGMNLIIGAALAILILLIFLRDIRPTFIVGMAIPVSIITAFVLMYFSGITLNVVSMGGLALGVGMLVDNSIVVIENIYRMRNEGKSAKKAAIKGAGQVAGAITASTLTTISVFLPIVFTEGMTREIFTDMGLTIAYSLLASLIIALTFVPMAASKLIKKKDKHTHKGLNFIQRFYESTLKGALNHKAVVVLLVIVLFAGSLYMAVENGTEYFPATDSGQINIDITLPSGTNFNDARDIIDDIDDDISAVKGIETIGTTMGNGMMLSIMGGGGSSGSSDSATMYVLLDDERENTTAEIAQEIRDITENSPAEIAVSDAGGMDMSALSGGAIVVEIRGKSFDTLEEIAMDMETLVTEVEGTTEVDNGITKGAPELQVNVDQAEAIKYNLTPVQIYGVVNAVLAAESPASTLSNEDGEFDIYITQESEEFTKSDLEDLMITTYTGDSVKLSEVAEVVETVGYSSISRTDQQRSMSVTASLEEDYNIGNVATDIQDELDDYDVPEGYSVTLIGENEMIQDGFSDLYLLLALAIALIYMIMAAQFQSLKSPFIVMFTIPLAFTGGFLGLVVAGLPISIVSFVGMIILAGVVVNNGIVFVDYTNKLVEGGMRIRKAIVAAGHARLRPIIMTALTTIIALSTMTVGAGMGTELIQPMAITAVGGLIYATILTLVFVPVLYEAMHKDKKRKGKA